MLGDLELLSASEQDAERSRMLEDATASALAAADIAHEMLVCVGRSQSMSRECDLSSIVCGMKAVLEVAEHASIV